SYTTGRQATPQVAITPSGDFVVVWISNQEGGGNYDVFGRSFRASGAPMGPDFRVNTYTTLQEIHPYVAVGHLGEKLVVFQRFIGLGNPVLISGQLYGSVGLPGDANGDGSVDVDDVFYLINHLFALGPPPIGSADVNDDGNVDVNDVFYLINYLFAGGPSPL